jgi:Trp operon repressor
MNEKQTSAVKKNINNKTSVIIPSIDDYSSRQEWEEASWRKILKSKELLQLLITSHERYDLIMRAAALKGLTSGKSYRQVSKELFLSLQTISGVKKAMVENNYRSYLERSKKERKKKKYSIGPISSKPRHHGRPHRTKYGTIYLPY